MSNDIRSLITSGSRTKVSPRDATLSNNIKKQKVRDSSPTDNSAEEASSSGQIEKLETELSQLPQNGKRLAVHLEKKLRNELVTYCNQEEITPETFVEASLVVLKQHREIKDRIAKEARSRLSLRKRAGFLRRTISMLKGI